jgi:hypothetical protein
MQQDNDNKRMTRSTPPSTPGPVCQGWPGECPDAAPAVVALEWRDWRSQRWRTLHLCARCEHAFAPAVCSGTYLVRNRRKPA